MTLPGLDVRGRLHLLSVELNPSVYILNTTPTAGSSRTGSLKKVPQSTWVVPDLLRLEYFSLRRSLHPRSLPFRRSHSTDVNLPGSSPRVPHGYTFREILVESEGLHTVWLWEQQNDRWSLLTYFWLIITKQPKSPLLFFYRCPRFSFSLFVIVGF